MSVDTPTCLSDTPGPLHQACPPLSSLGLQVVAGRYGLYLSKAGPSQNHGAESLSRNQGCAGPAADQHAQSGGTGERGGPDLPGGGTRVRKLCCSWGTQSQRFILILKYTRLGPCLSWGYPRLGAMFINQQS